MLGVTVNPGVRRPAYQQSFETIETRVPVVPGRANQIEPNAIPPPVRRAFESRQEEAVSDHSSLGRE